MPGVVRSDSRLAVVEVDGVEIGITDSVTGGALSTVLIGTAGPDGTINQHVSHPLYEPLSWTMGAADSGLPDWVVAAVNRRELPSQGSLSFRSTTGEEAQRLAWGGVTELHVRFPSLDTTRSERAVMTVTVHADRLRRTAGSGSAPSTPEEGRQPQWLVNNFRLTIDGVDCSRVRRVLAPEVVLTATSSDVGVHREPTAGTVSSRVGNLSLELDDATGFFAWYDDVVVQGNNGAAGERSGTLEYLAADLKQVLFSVELRSLGIMRVAPQWTALSGKPSTTQVDLYCEALVVRPTGAPDTQTQDTLTHETQTSSDTSRTIETPVRTRPPIGRTIPDLPPFTRPR